LKAVDVQLLRDAALVIDAEHTYNTSSYTWAPVIDGYFLTQTLSQATIKGQVNTEFGFGMYNTFEGSRHLLSNYAPYIYFKPRTELHSART
jgi:hypothetical protein